MGRVAVRDHGGARAVVARVVCVAAVHILLQRLLVDTDADLAQTNALLERCQRLGRHLRGRLPRLDWKDLNVLDDITVLSGDSVGIQ